MSNPNQTVDADAIYLTTTDELVAHYVPRRPDIDPDAIERVVGAAIDALYANRDAGGNMHSSGAACAVAVLEALRGEGSVLVVMDLELARALADHPATLQPDDPGMVWVAKVKAATKILWAAIHRAQVDDHAKAGA